MIFYLCFYHQLWVKWVCIDIRNSPGHIEQTHSRKYWWMFDTEWKAHQTDILDHLLNDNLSNTSSTPPSEGKKTLLYIAHLIILPTSTETSIY